MANKILLTSDGPYVGVTTVARRLEQTFGYHRVSMSDQLIAAFVAQDWVQWGYPGLTVQDVLNNKPYWRTSLQDFGRESLYDTDERWQLETLRTLVGKRKVVIEKARTDEQVKFWKAQGYIIVRLYVPEYVREARAAALGLPRDQLHEVLQDSIEHGVSLDLVDYTISNGGVSPTEVAVKIAGLPAVSLAY